MRRFTRLLAVASALALLAAACGPDDVAEEPEADEADAEEADADEADAHWTRSTPSSPPW